MQRNPFPVSNNWFDNGRNIDDSGLHVLDLISAPNAFLFFGNRFVDPRCFQIRCPKLKYDCRNDDFSIPLRGPWYWQAGLYDSSLVSLLSLRPFAHAYDFCEHRYTRSSLRLNSQSGPPSVDFWKRNWIIIRRDVQFWIQILHSTAESWPPEASHTSPYGNAMTHAAVHWNSGRNNYPE